VSEWERGGKSERETEKEREIPILLLYNCPDTLLTVFAE